MGLYRQVKQRHKTDMLKKTSFFFNYFSATASNRVNMPASAQYPIHSTLFSFLDRSYHFLHALSNELDLINVRPILTYNNVLKTVPFNIGI